MKPAIEGSYSLKTSSSLIKNSFPIPNMLHRPPLTHSKVKVGKLSAIRSIQTFSEVKAEVEAEGSERKSISW